MKKKNPRKNPVKDGNHQRVAWDSSLGLCLPIMVEVLPNSTRMARARPHDGQYHGRQCPLVVHNRTSASCRQHVRRTRNSERSSRAFGRLRLAGVTYAGTAVLTRTVEEGSWLIVRPSRRGRPSGNSWPRRRPNSTAGSTMGRAGQGRARSRQAPPSRGVRHGAVPRSRIQTSQGTGGAVRID